MEATIAIGDANNDILMLQTVNLGIAMGNAINEVKEVSKYVTTAIGDDGVYNAFLHFGLIPEMK